MPRLLLSLITACLFALPLLAQLTPAQAVAEMGRGINLGNTLEPPQEGAWNNGPAQESYFDAYVEAGFTNVRIPVRWDEHTAATAPFAVDAAWMDRVEQVVDWGLERGFYVTLNGHHEDWLKQNYNNATLRDRYDAIWTQIVARFKDKSDKLLYEIINEPFGMSVAQVDDLNARILGIIRAEEPTRLVIYGGNQYSNSQELINAAIPDDDYLIGYFHAYDPWPFSGMGQGTWGTPGDYAQLTNKFTQLKNWSVSNNMPIYYSEFGAVVGNEFNSRMRIYAHYTELAVANEFAFSVWDDGGMFKVLERGSNSWPETKDILLHYYSDSPHQITSSANADESAVTLSWNNRMQQATEPIVIERAVGFDNTYVAVATLDAQATGYVDTDIDGGVYTYRMYTHRPDGTLVHGYPTRVSLGGGGTGAFGGVPTAIPGVLEIENYDLGGQDIAFNDVTAANEAGGTLRPGDAVDIGSDGNGGWLLGYVAQGEWLKFTVDVAETGRYSVRVRTASEQANGEFTLTFSGNAASTTVTTPNTGGWVTWQNIDANAELDLVAGEQEMRFDVTGASAFNLDNITFTLEAVNTEAAAEAAGFTAQPNPTNGMLQVQLPETLVPAAARLLLTDLTGRTVAQFHPTDTRSILDLSRIGAGSYLLRLQDGDRHWIRRVVLVR